MTDQTQTSATTPMPWYKSGVVKALLVAIILKLGHVALEYSKNHLGLDLTPILAAYNLNADTIATWVLNSGVLASLAYALHARLTSQIAPVTLRARKPDPPPYQPRGVRWLGPGRITEVHTPEQHTMTVVVPVIAPTVDPLVALEAAIVGGITAKYILSAADVPSQLARAQQLLAINEALLEVNSGQANGVQDLQTAVSNFVQAIKDPALQLVMNELLAVMDTQIAALASTFVGKLVGLTNNLLITQIAQVAQYYVTLLSTPAAAAAH